LGGILSIDHLKEVTTEDGSLSLFNELYQEGCHSLAGAKSETMTHYIFGTKLDQKIITQKNIHILEVGFGSGLGFVTTREFLNEYQYQFPVQFISLEKDISSITWANNHYGLNLEQHPFGYRTQDKNITLIILTGDARESLPRYLKEQKNQHHIVFDCIYQDAFSPKKNPELWTKNWFHFLKSTSHPNCILSTYSASNSIRKSLIEAGWNIYSGVNFGPKRASTRAKLTGTSEDLLIELIKRSPVDALSETCPRILNYFKGVF
jgi:tRNA U34 5-methylaminomethyl-2-thiouridine-forming methyltransferase MnmC